MCHRGLLIAIVDLLMALFADRVRMGEDGGRRGGGYLFDAGMWEGHLQSGREKGYPDTTDDFEDGALKIRGPWASPITR